MILFLAAAVALAAAALGPAALLLQSRPPAIRDRRESALGLHRAQLRELDRDAALGLVDRAEHGGARLEIERRLLAAAEASPEPAAAGEEGGRAMLAAGLVAIPVLAAALYAVGGHPGWPAAPLAPRLAAASRATEAADPLIAQLRARLATLDPHSPEARGGNILLGNVEARLGRWSDAATAWRTAMGAGFDATLADEAAEAGILAHGNRVGDHDAALLRQALAAAPVDAGWRMSAEARLAEYQHQSLAP